MTPLEIQKREFSRKWKGLDPVEVQPFLVDVAEDMEALARENADLETRLRSLEQENDEHRERERILKQTLLSAQQASEDIRDAARKEAELVVREAHDSAEQLTHSALQRSAEIEKAIHELKIQRTNFRLQLQKMIELFQQVLEFDRDEDDKDRPLSYLTRKAEGRDEGCGRVRRLPGSSRVRNIACLADAARRSTRRAAARPRARSCRLARRRRARRGRRLVFVGAETRLSRADVLAERARPTPRSTPPAAPSFPDSWTRTRTPSGWATAAPRSGGGSRARATRRSRPRAAASTPPSARRAPERTRARGGASRGGSRRCSPTARRPPRRSRATA